MPWFDLVSEDHRIQSTDADFVDIIHTNSGNLIVGDLSFPDPLGQVDFYPNGGSHQNGCFYLKGMKIMIFNSISRKIVNLTTKLRFDRIIFIQTRK